MEGRNLPLKRLSGTTGHDTPHLSCFRTPIRPFSVVLWMRVDPEYKQNKFLHPECLAFDLPAGIYVQIALYLSISLTLVCAIIILVYLNYRIICCYMDNLLYGQPAMYSVC